MDKATKWKRIMIYLVVCLYLVDIILRIINDDYLNNSGIVTMSIAFFGIFGYLLIKQFYLYKERNNEFSKTIVAISIIMVALSLFDITNKYITYISGM